MLYVRATDEMLASETREREIAPLKSIRDNHEKIVVARQGSYDTDIDDFGAGYSVRTAENAEWRRR